jgi:hypothetical protein
MLEFFYFIFIHDLPYLCGVCVISHFDSVRLLSRRAAVFV